MFSHDKDPATVVCLAGHGRIKRGAIVPKSNELYADVEDWLAAGNTLAPFSGYPDNRTLPEVQQDQLRKINAGCEAEISTLRTTYPESEVLSWDKQEREARAYLADPTARVPLLSGLAAARGIALGLLAQKVVEKADAYTAAISAAIGQHQALEDQLMATTTQAEAEAVSWPQ